MRRPRIPRKTALWPIVRAMLAALTLAVPVGLFAAARVASIELGYRLGRLQAEEIAIERENQRLTLEVSTLRAPVRLERLARERLHLASPGTGDVLVEGGQATLAPGRVFAERR